VLTPECANELINAVNGDAPAWARRLWPSVLANFKVGPSATLPDAQFSSAATPSPTGTRFLEGFCNRLGIELGLGFGV